MLSGCARRLDVVWNVATRPLEKRCVLKDFAANSQALADSRRATKDLGDAILAGAPVETINELTAIRAAAEERVLLLRGRTG